jgi:lactobin A/cerein 7B family class IIb bacteriocin
MMKLSEQRRELTADDLDEVNGGGWPIFEYMMAGAGASGLGKLADGGFKTGEVVGNRVDLSL